MCLAVICKGLKKSALKYYDIVIVAFLYTLYFNIVAFLLTPKNCFLLLRDDTFVR